MTIDVIADAAKRVKQKYGETDPWKLAREMNILVAPEPMGLHDGCCKGFFMIHSRIKHITINSDLPEELQRIILAHELGHAVLHTKRKAFAAFHEMTLFDSVHATEYEANVFASELLLSDEAVLEALNDDMFFFQAASVLQVPAELLDFKFRVLKRRGYKVESPILSQGDFLKNVEKKANETNQYMPAKEYDFFVNK